MKNKAFMILVLTLALFSCKKEEEVNFYNVDLFITGTSTDKILTFQTNNELVTQEIYQKNLVYRSNSLRGGQIIRIGAESRDTGSVVLSIIIDADTVRRDTFTDNIFNYIQYDLK